MLMPKPGITPGHRLRVLLFNYREHVQDYESHVHSFTIPEHQHGGVSSGTENTAPGGSYSGETDPPS